MLNENTEHFTIMVYQPLGNTAEYTWFAEIHSKHKLELYEAGNGKAPTEEEAYRAALFAVEAYYRAVIKESAEGLHMLQELRSEHQH